MNGDNCEVLVMGVKADRDLKEEESECCLQY